MNTKLLKQKILDLAIRGKLVPQDPNDEPASVLLERIKAEKERLIAEGKIKRSKKSAQTSDKPHYENVPFDIPDSWEWIRLSDIASFGGGKTPSMNVKNYWDNGRNLWVTSKDMKRYRIDDSIMKISDEALSIMNQYEPGTILIVTRSGILRHSLPVAILDKKATVNQDLKTISLFLKELNPYIFLTIKANESFILKEYHKDGTTVDSINFEKFSNILLPLPPVREQLHICSVVEGLFRLIDDLEASKQNLQDVIKQTKSKVLDLAIHGKLVPQDPTDEPASELLKRINPDAKPCDTSHYKNIPSSWCVCTLKDVFEITMGSSPKGSSINTQKNGIEFHQGKISFTDMHLQETNVYTDEPTKLAEPHSILLCVRAPVGIVNITERNVCIGRGLCALKPTVGVDYKFAFYTLQTHKANFDKQATGTTFKAIGGDIIRNEKYVLPPYQEQIRIREKIEYILQLLNAITAEL